MQLVAYGAQDVYLKNLQGRKTSGNIEKIRYSETPFVDSLEPRTLIREFKYLFEQNNPSEKIKLLETPKAYSTKHILREMCGQEKNLGYSDNE